jgi:hypothetical protein
MAGHRWRGSRHHARNLRGEGPGQIRFNLPQNCMRSSTMGESSGFRNKLQIHFGLIYFGVTD